MYLTQLRMCINSSNCSYEMESQVRKEDKLTSFGYFNYLLRLKINLYFFNLKSRCETQSSLVVKDERLIMLSQNSVLRQTLCSVI